MVSRCPQDVCYPQPPTACPLTVEGGLLLPSYVCPILLFFFGLAFVCDANGVHFSRTISRMASRFSAVLWLGKSPRPQEAA